MAIKTNPKAAALQSEHSEQKRARLGQFEFINALPVVLPLGRGLVAIDTEVTLAAPAQLNQMIAEGALDVSAMSSFQYLSRPDFVCVPDLSISCLGPVGSVLLFSKHDLNTLASPDKRIVVSAQSATSVHLVKICLLEQYGQLPQFVASFAPDIEVDNVDAVLVIGDRALEVDTAWSTRYLRIDLGDWWCRTIGAPMVFGLWAARRDWVESSPDQFAQLCRSLKQARETGLTTALEAVLDEAELRTGLARTRLHHYFTSQINYELTGAHLDGLKVYREMVIKHGLLPAHR